LFLLLTDAIASELHMYALRYFTWDMLKVFGKFVLHFIGICIHTVSNRLAFFIMKPVLKATLQCSH
jgi:hypothetical protein